MNAYAHSRLNRESASTGIHTRYSWNQAFHLSPPLLPSTPHIVLLLACVPRILHPPSLPPYSFSCFAPMGPLLSGPSNTIKQLKPMRFSTTMLLAILDAL